MRDSFLFKIRKINTKHSIDIWVGYDHDDRIYSKWLNRIQFKANWVRCYFPGGDVVSIWNLLYQKAVETGKYDYFWIAGDDIEYDESDWLDALVQSLESTNGVGVAGVNNGNPNLPMTQFLVSKKHFEFFSFAYPPELTNWYCDNWIQEIYPQQFVHYHSKYLCPNAGGEPRYTPAIDSGEWKQLLKKYKFKLNALQK